MKTLVAVVLLAGGCTLTFVACSRSASQAKIKADFDHICAAQKDFLSARRLKGVDEAELLVERMRRMREGLSSETAIQVADQLNEPASFGMRSLAEKAAAEAGLTAWNCPALEARR